MMPSGERIRIALFHHDPEVVGELQAMLSPDDGFELTVSDNALLGLSTVSAAPPDLVLAAADLPILDGFQLLSLMRSPDYGSLNDLPVILLGAEALTSAHRARELGAHDFLSWPTTGQLVLFAVRRAHAARQGESLNAVVPVLSSNDVVFQEVRDALEGQEELEIQRVSGAQELSKLAGTRVVELAIADTAEGETRALLDAARALDVPVLVANTAPPNPAAARELLIAGATDVVQAGGRHDELGTACRNHLRRSRSRSLNPSSRQDVVEHFFDSADSGILLVRLDTGRVLAANTASNRIFCRTRENLQRSTLLDLFGGESASALESGVARARKQGASVIDLGHRQDGGPAFGKITFTLLGWSELLLVTVPRRPS